MGGNWGGTKPMFVKPWDTEEELEHLHDLLRRQNGNLRHTERQIASFAPSLVPLHLLNQREEIEAERTKILQRLDDLEAAKVEGTGTERPQVETHLLLTSLPTGVLHLYSQDNLPLLKYELANPGSAAVSVILSSWIEQFSYTRSDTVPLGPGQTQVLTQLPTLKLDEIADIYEVRKATLHTRGSYVKEGQELLLFIQDFDITFLARDVLVWAILEDTKKVKDLSYQLAAWVTPNEPSIVEMLRHAADFGPDGQLCGYQGAKTAKEGASQVRRQVEAIYQALKLKAKLTYIHAPISFGQKANEVQQRVNLPKDSLKYQQANCIDGSVLYASLIERAAMNPVIVLVRSHAFVGWETWKGSGQYEFLETTMTGSHNFQDAFQEGMKRFEAAEPLLGQPFFDPKGFAVLLNIKALRQRGILPIE
jgi:hypothetical protein